MRDRAYVAELARLTVPLECVRASAEQKLIRRAFHRWATLIAFASVAHVTTGYAKRHTCEPNAVQDANIAAYCNILTATQREDERSASHATAMQPAPGHVSSAALMHCMQCATRTACCHMDDACHHSK